MDAKIQQFVQELKYFSDKKISFRMMHRIFIIFLNLMKFTTARTACVTGATKKTVRLWRTRYAEVGLACVSEQKRVGRKPYLNTSEIQELKQEIIISNSKESENKIVHMNIFKEKVFLLFKKKYSLSGAYKFANKHMIRKVVPRTVHEKNETQKMKAWVDELPNKIAEIKEQNPGKEVEIYFQDESRYGQMTIKSGVWNPYPFRPECKTQVGYLNSWIFAAANKNTGKYFGLILPNLNSYNMQLFLNEFSKTIEESKHVLMILDGASSHKSKSICIPKNISLHFLPPYSPELNPIERLWLYIKKNFLSFKTYKNIDEVIQKGADAWSYLNQEIVKSVMCSQKKTQGG